jgi:hypothetical protein
MGCLFFFNKKSEDTKGAKLQILLNKMDVYFLLVSDSMSINAKFPVMFKIIGMLVHLFLLHGYFRRKKTYIYIY